MRRSLDGSRPAEPRRAKAATPQRAAELLVRSAGRRKSPAAVLTAQRTAGNRAVSRLFGSVGETRAPTRVLQRMTDGTLYRHALLQALDVKDTYDLHVWKDGEFVTTGAVKQDHEGSAIHEMHYHLYAPVTAAGSVKIEGHVVWAKNLATGKSNRCGFTILATADDDMTWTVKIDLAGEDDYFLDKDKNTSVRDALKKEITSLKGLIEDVLNTSDADLPEIEDIPEGKKQPEKGRKKK